jgi:hypothetical protein
MNKHEVVHKKDDHAFDSARYFATTRPDLTPFVDKLVSKDTPTTLSYEEMWTKLRDDPTVEFADDLQDDTSWETSIEYGEFYE